MIRPDTPDILAKIVSMKRREVERLKVDVPLRNLERRMQGQTAPLDAAAALRGDGTGTRVIAELKKASPTKGLLMPNFDAATLATTYVENGAAALSVLTEVDHFKGHIEYLEVARKIAYPRGVPVLRKEFIFDPYQVYEARAYGADFLLLIVAMLGPKDLQNLRERAESLGMQCLVEVHDTEELQIALDTGASIIGVNNRDLRTFVTDLGTTERVAAAAPKDRVLVSESGIASREHVERVQMEGAHAVLVGESLVVSGDPGAKLRELMGTA